MYLYSSLICLPLIVGNVVCIPTIDKEVNGVDAVPGEIPYIVRLEYGPLGTHVCDGAILNDLHVLTAAHCIHDLPYFLNVRYGSIKSNEGTKIPVIKKILHPKFNPIHLTNDIAVLKLESAITFSELTQPVVLPDLYEVIPANEWAVVAGWGTPNSNGNSRINLKRIDVLVRSEIDCIRDLGSDFNRQFHICTSGSEDSEGHCWADPGSTLVLNRSAWHLFGLLSWTNAPCEYQGNPSVFTQVSTYVDWINKAMT